MPFFVKQTTLDASEKQAKALAQDLDQTLQELESTKSMLHEMDKKYESLFQLQSAKDEKFKELQKQGKVFEEQMQQARGALNAQTVKAQETLAQEQRRFDEKLTKVIEVAASETSALKANLSGLHNDLQAEVEANKVLRQTVSDLRQNLSRLQTERDNLEAQQRHVRLECESQVRAIETASQARIGVLEAELNGLKRKV